MKPDRAILRHPGLRPIWRAIQREWWLQLLVFNGLTSFGIVLLYLTYPAAPALGGIGLLCAMIGLFQLARQFRRLPGDHQLVHLLHHRPQEIVWVYAMLTQRLPFGIQLLPSCTVYFKLLDGGEVSVGIPMNKLRLVMHTLNRVIPRALFGYTVERAQRFDLDPKNLRR